MHLTGLLGMPRRVYTYAPDLGWNGLNMVSTVGAFIFAGGVLLFFVDAVRTFRKTARQPTAIYGMRRRWNGCPRKTMRRAAFPTSGPATPCGTVRK